MANHPLAAGDYVGLPDRASGVYRQLLRGVTCSTGSTPITSASGFSLFTAALSATAE